MADTEVGMNETQRRSITAQFCEELSEARVQMAKTKVADGVAWDEADERQFAKSRLRKLFVRYTEKTYSDPSLARMSDADRQVIERGVMDRSFDGGSLIAIWNAHPDALNMTVSGAGNCRLEMPGGHIVRGPQVAVSSDGLFGELRALASYNGVKEVPWDPTQPELELILEDGTRLTAQNWTTAEVFVTLRRPTMKGKTLADLVGNGTMTPRCASLLGAALRAGLRVIVAGNMNAGKTVVLRAMAAELPNDSHLVTVESQRELLLHEYPSIYGEWVTAMEARRANAEGQGELPLASLITSVQRMSPSYVLVGEVRGGAEAQAYLKALQQGYALAGTIHANSSLNAIEVLAQYYEEASGARYETALRRAASNIDLSVFMKQLPNGRRVVHSVRQVIEYHDGIVKSEELWVPDPEQVGASTENTDQVISVELFDQLRAAGYDSSLSDAAAVVPQ